MANRQVHTRWHAAQSLDNPLPLRKQPPASRARFGRFQRRVAAFCIEQRAAQLPIDAHMPGNAEKRPF